MKKILFILFAFSLIQVQAQNTTVFRGRKAAASVASSASILYSNKFIFTLPDAATTSAGVYTADSTLVRTLWSNERYEAGSHVDYWDGLLDNRTVAPISSYHIRVLSHNVTYTWDGARIGNTSTALTGSTIHRAFKEPLCMAITGDSLYYGCGYQEQFATQFVTNLNTIGNRNRVVPYVSGVGHTTTTCATDGNYVYWGGYFEQKCFVFATRKDNNAMVSFSAGEQFSTYPNYSGISVSNESNGITSIAVQKTGNYLFVARSNTLGVLNKLTGDTIQQITLSGIGSLSVDYQDKLWLSHGSVVEKYNVNNDGTITSTGTTLTGITEPAAIAVSPDNNTVLVADAAISQQVIKGFNNSSGGAALWTMGTPGGYITNAAVTNDKFFFSKAGGKYFSTSIAFQKDGSFWVIDGGNSRIQHYSSSRVFINRISYMPTMYFTHVDNNNKNRLFSSQGSSCVEFAMDYTKQLDNGENGSWILTNNWGANIPDNANNETGFEIQKTPNNVITFAGRTYTILNTYHSNYYVFELVPNGNLRQTKVQIYDHKILKNGDRIANTNGYGVGTASQYKLYAFTGLDSDNDPVWAETPYKTINGPVATSLDAVGPFTENQITGNKLIYFQGNAVTNGTGDEYHLSAFDINTGQWNFKTAMGTYRDYNGDFPAKGEFDNGNNVLNAGRSVLVDGTNIVWTYNGEFWKASQTNYFNHVHTSGLFIGRFGEDKNGDNNLEANPPGVEGNNLNCSWVQDTPDRAFVYSGGEGIFAGVHRWRIEGLSTVKTQVCTFNPNLNYITPSGSLMGKFDHLTTNISGNYGWTTSHPNGSGWFVIAGQRTAFKYGPQDINAYYGIYDNNSSSLRTLSRTLGANTNSNTWKLHGKVRFDQPSTIDTRGGIAALEVLDNSGKVIAQLSVQDVTWHSGSSNVIANGSSIHYYNYIDDYKYDLRRSKPFQISNSNGTLTFQYAGYSGTTTVAAENGANVGNPSTVRLRFTPGDYQKSLSVSELNFIKN